MKKGRILDISKMSGNILDIIIVLIRCVIWGAKIFFTFLRILLFKRSWPVLLLFLRFLIIFLVFSSVIGGKLKVFWFFGIKNSKI